MGGNVFANGLEISGKATQGKTIAVFPDVCFTPPQTPATPPGVPIPYPSFGMAGDTEKGTSTVKISDGIVNLKNKSDLSKTTGTEAGSAPKKGVISSKNTGKSFFNSWSPDVKFEGEPVIRMTDLATHNHGSQPNTPPWAHVLKIQMSTGTCETILADLDLRLHAHGDKGSGDNKVCDKGDQSEHMMQNALFQNSRGDSSGSIPGFDGANGYSANGAPCICMEGPGGANAKTPDGRFSAHGQKTAAQRKFASDQNGTRPTVKSAVDNEMSSIKDHHPKIPDDKKGEEALECLKAICYAYLEKCTGKKRDDVEKMETRVPWGDKIPKATSSTNVSP